MVKQVNLIKKLEKNYDSKIILIYIGMKRKGVDIMYAINLDFDPTTVGFDQREITNNYDGTYTVKRLFVHAQHFHASNYNYDIQAYCPCITDNVEIYCYQVDDYKGRTKYGVSYITNDREKYSTEGGSLTNSRIDYMHPIGTGVFNKKFDTHIENSKEEQAVAFCVSIVNGHPDNITRDLEKEYYEKYHIVFSKAAPTSPQEDPFLPEAFKKMLVV